MPTLADLRMPPPRSWDEFEAIVCSAAKNRWDNPEFTRHGRQGQRQDGVDIFGQDDKGRLVGLQCKNTLDGLTAATISAEVEKAESFKPALQQLFVVTTADTDKHLQEFVRDLSEQRSKAGTFEVAVLFWPDVWADLTRDESRLFQHYPHLRGGAVAAQEPSHDQRLYDDLKATLGFEPAIRLLRDHDFGGPFQRKAIQPLFDFYETWDSPEKQFIDKELQAGLEALYKAAAELSDHLVEKTVPVGNGTFASVFSDSLRAMGPRPEWVKEEARVLNEQAHLFVPLYEQFMLRCRDKLVR
ncbi:hypothetical protein [Ottowia sp. VDI28]|uniref:hypothetical protein n=1 Tax=Ottowia sp. VDI28 TaxID=3133968 RepID=UPI003C30CB16